jgi:hypothetical protein
MTYYEEDLPDVSENEVERAENEGMPDHSLIPEGMHHIKATVENIDPGTNHIEMMEMLGGIFVQLSRIYDVLMMGVPSATRDMLDEMHGEGGLMASPPVLREDAWSDE